MVAQPCKGRGRSATDRDEEREGERGRDTRPSRGGIQSWTSRLRGGTKMAVRGEARVRNATPRVASPSVNSMVMHIYLAA